MNSLSDVIDQIINTLKKRPSAIPAEVLAEQYYAACDSVNARLSRIQVMLENGSDIEALQVAEESPPLMGLVALLSFGDEIVWQEYCEAHGNAVAPLIDFRNVETLTELYKKGLSPNHPLYRDYRAAIRSRDDDKALELLGIIARLNPSDANAIKEKQRLGRKGTLAELEQLKTCLETGTEAELIAKMAKVEAIAPDDDYRTRPEWQAALVQRGIVEKREARQKMSSLLTLAEKNLGAETWRTAAGHEAEISRLAGEYGFPNEDGFSERLQAVTSVLSEFREEAEREAAIRKIVKKLESLTEEADTRGVTPEGITVTYATSTLDTIRRQERELSRLNGSVPDSSRARIRATTDRLEQIVQLSRSKKKVRNATVGAVAAIVLLAGAGFGFLAMQASSFKGELDAAISSGSAQRAKSLVDSADRSGLMFKFPSVVAKVAEAEQWAANRTEEAGSAEGLLADLEKGARSGFSDLHDAPALLSKLETCEKLVSEVTADLRPPLASRYAVVRNEGEARLLALQKDSAKRATEVTERCRKFAENVDYHGFADAVSKPLDVLRAKIRNLEPLLAQDDDLLKLPVNVASELKAVSAQIEDVYEKTKAVEDAYRGLAAADDLVSFREKLALLAETRFADAGQTRAIDAAIPNADKIKANLLTVGDLAVYKLAVTLATAKKWVPKLAGEREREWVKELRSHPCFAEIYEVRFKEFAGFSRGEPVKDVNESNKMTTVKMDFSEMPMRRGDLPSYRSVSEKFTNPSDFSATLSGAAALMTKLNLYGFLDNSGTSYNRSAVELVDIIFQEKSCPALARAFLLGEVFGLMSKAETEWGTFLSSTLQKDIKEYHLLSEKEWVRPSDWMMKNRATSAKAWEDYFSARKPGSRANEIVKNGKMIASVERAEIELCGHVNRAGEVVWQDESGTGLVLGFSPDAQGENARLCVVGAMNGKNFKPTMKLAPMSPLILIALSDTRVEFLLSINPVGHIFD